MTTTTRSPEKLPRHWPARLDRSAVAERLLPLAHSGSVRRLAWVAAGAAVLTGTVVSLLRQPGPGALDTIWDEDGRIFLADAKTSPIAAAFAKAYEGYYHAVPRLLAEVAAVFPADDAAAVLAILAAVTTALLAIFVYVAARAHLPNVPMRLLASVPVVVAPLAQNEVPNTICNLHWPLLYVTFWALLWTPTRRVGKIVAVLVVALTAASDLMAVVLLPAALVRLYLQRSRQSLALAGALLAAAAIQLGGLLLNHNPRDIAQPRLNLGWAIASYVLRAVPQVILGARFLDGKPRSGGYLLLVGVAWLVVICAVIVAWRRRQARWPLAAAMFLQSVVLYSALVMAGGLAVPRYAFAPGLMVMVGLAALVHPRPGSVRGRKGSAAAMALVALVGLVCAINLRVDNPRAAGPSWQDSLRTARTACIGQPATATVPVGVSPLQDQVMAQLPCGYLRSP